MRITNSMIMNNSLLNLNRGLEKLQMYDQQVQTGKQFQYASENPIAAGKAIRFNTRLYELSQYKSNLNSAQSWLENSESSIKNTEKIITRVRELCEESANETQTPEDRLKAQVEIKELREQLIQEANANVAGRYIFSGYKTDEKVMFDSYSDKSFEIKESLPLNTAREVSADETGVDKNLSVKLTYGKIEEGTGTFKFEIDGKTYPSSGPTGNDPIYNIVYKNQSDADAYDVPESTSNQIPLPVPEVNTVHIIRETGEIVFNKKDYESMSGNVEVTYNKTGFDKGDINPVHYLNASERITPKPEKIGEVDTNGIIKAPELGGIREDSIVGLKANGNDITNIVYYDPENPMPAVPADGACVNMKTGEIMMGSNYSAGTEISITEYHKEYDTPGTSVTHRGTPEIVLKNGGTLAAEDGIVENTFENMSYGGTPLITNGVIEPGVTISYVTSNSPKLPVAGEVVIEKDTGKVIVGDMTGRVPAPISDEIKVDEYKVNEEENIEFEVQANGKMVVNSKASDIFTLDLIKDLDLLINKFESGNKDDVTRECTTMLGRIDKHLDQVLKIRSTIGSRTNRADLIDARISDDTISYKSLKSENEDVDQTEALTDLMMQEVVYNAALSSTSKVIQKSLLDFLR